MKELSSYKLEELITTFKIDLWGQGFRKNGTDETGQPIYEYGVETWVAKSKLPRIEYAEGNTVREAVEKVVNKLIQ
jgi:hypothetical protein